MSEPFVILRNTESGVAYSYTPEQARQFLDHPVFGQYLKEVRTAKLEVLAAPKSEREASKKDSE